MASGGQGVGQSGRGGSALVIYTYWKKRKVVRSRSSVRRGNNTENNERRGGAKKLRKTRNGEKTKNLDRANKKNIHNKQETGWRHFGEDE